jgi:hypothetical protein
VIETNQIRPGDCHVCGKDMDIMVLLPRARGNTAIFGCIECAIRLGLYCERHASPHTAFEDGLSACLKCIEELSAKDESVCRELLTKLRKGLSQDEREDLDEWLLTVTAITGHSEARCFMRALAGKALRLGVPTEAIEVRVMREQSHRSPLLGARVGVVSRPQERLREERMTILRRRFPDRSDEELDQIS